jgi:hypothetical protein
LKKCLRSLGQRGRARRLGDAHEELREAWAPPASEGGSHRLVALQPIHFSLQQPRRCSPFSGLNPRFDARVTTDAYLVVELPGPSI